jgi:hypothetical protein
MSRELTSTMSRAAIERHRMRERSRADIDSLDLIRAPNPFPEPADARNRVSLANGTWGNAAPRKHETTLAGVGAGATMTAHTVIVADCLLEGLSFVAQPFIEEPLITVQAGTLLVRGGRFWRPETSTTPFIVTARGAACLLVGCWFSGSSGAGMIVDGTATATGCVNLTGGGWGPGVTTVGCI